MDKKIAIIIGAGPAGLSAAYSILKYTNNIKPIIIEEDNTIGGLSKTLDNNNNGVDIGAHRFFTKHNEVFKLWTEFLDVQECPAADDKLFNRFPFYYEGKVNPENQDNVFLKRKRFSRIYYNNNFIDYPIKLNLAIIKALGLKRTLLAGFSYIKSCLRKQKEINLETFMINRFGKVLYQLFFEKYTEKVWGVHPSLISKEWGEQRIKKISVFNILTGLLFTLLGINVKKETSLIDEYYYPKLGSSQIYNLMADKIKKLGGEIILNSRVTKIYKSGNQVRSVEYINTQTNETKILNGEIFISSMPIKDLLTNMNEVPDDIMDIANNLPYRDFILVNFVLNKINLKNNTNYPTINNITPDSWIYLQDSQIKAGRLNIMNNFSPYIINDFKKDIVVSLEYFCNENDEFWNKSDSEIIDFAVKELVSSSITDISNIENKKCFRIKKAYPAYFGSYSQFYKIKDYINKIDNLYCIGRNGQHKYNNMDHSILSGIIAAKIINQNSDKTLLWDINTDINYQEIK